SNPRIEQFILAGLEDFTPQRCGAAYSIINHINVLSSVQLPLTNSRCWPPQPDYLTIFEAEEAKEAKTDF
ncbi:TPA: hypothetical protein ACP7UR_005175, partial [Escherichia coli]